VRDGEEPLLQRGPFQDVTEVIEGEDHRDEDERHLPHRLGSGVDLPEQRDPVQEIGTPGGCHGTFEIGGGPLRPWHGAARRQAHELLGFRCDGGAHQVQALARGFAAHPEQGDPGLQRWCAAKAKAGAGHGGVQIEHMKRLPGRAEIEARGGRTFPPALEVTGEHHGVALAVVLEPVAREAVAEPLVVVGQGRVGALADQRVPEHELLVPGKPAARAHRQHLLLDQPREPFAYHRRAHDPAQEPGHAALPAHLAEHAGGAQHTAGLDREPAEPGLHHGQHGLGQRLVLALGGRADQLLEVERVAVGPLDQALDGRGVDAVAEHLADQSLAGPAAQLLEPDLLDVLAVRP
jgi:hypothetical protein